MPAGNSQQPRALRADAQRNRDRILAVTREALTHGNASLSLEAIARDAGVGIGTLYRHFPTREALIEAIYAVELDALTASAGELLDRLPPDEALRAWMLRYADFAATKRGILETLQGEIVAADKSTAPGVRIGAAIAPILEAGARAGSLRADAHPEDVTVLLLAAFVTTVTRGDSAQTQRVLGLVMDALRPPAPRD